MNEGAEVHRRGFAVRLLYGLWALMGLALAAPAGVYLLFPPRARKQDEWVEAGDVSQLPSRMPEEVVFRRNRVDGWKVVNEKTSAWVVKISETELAAFAPMCTHLGCAYHWDAEKQHFLCPCHTSAFGLDGRVLSGPAPRPLDRYQVKVQGGKLLLGAVEKSSS